MKLPCPSTQCDYVTEEVDIQAALTLLAMLKEIDHQGNGPVATPQSCQRKPEKYPRPNITIGAMAGVMMTLANVYKVNRTMKGKDRLKVSHMFYGPYETSSKLDGFSHLRSEWTMQRRGSWP